MSGWDSELSGSALSELPARMLSMRIASPQLGPWFDRLVGGATLTAAEVGAS
jgi:hypothetical protein